MPSSTCSLFGGPSSAPSWTTQTLLRRRLGEEAVAEHDRLERAVVGRDLPRQHVAEQRDALDVAALPAEVARADAGHALVALLGRSAGFIGLAIMNTVGSMSGRHDVVAQRHAARHLDVDELVGGAAVLGQRGDELRGSARATASRL